MNKIVINKCYGGFSLSAKALQLFYKKKGVPEDCICGYDINYPRHDKDLVAVVEELGKEANGNYTNLVVAEIPGNVYRIEEYDGYESIITPDSIEWITIQ